MIENRAGIKAQIDLNLTDPKVNYLPIGRVIVDRHFAKQIELIAFALQTNIDDAKQYNIGGIIYDANSPAFHNLTLRTIRVEWLNYLKRTFRLVLELGRNHLDINCLINCVDFCPDDSHEMLHVYSSVVGTISASVVKAFFYDKSGLVYRSESDEIKCLLLPDAACKVFNVITILLFHVLIVMS